MTTTITLPPRWGADNLSAFVDTAFRNALATYANKPKQYVVLSQIATAFQTIGENLLNAKTLVGALLLLRSHSAYLGACRFALSGQSTEAFPVLRACLEYGLYAIHIHKNPDLAEVWVKRHDGEASMRQQRQRFNHTTVAESLKQQDPTLHTTIESLYQHCIDFGAHPNERAVTGSMKLIEGEDRHEFKQLYLHGDSLTLDHILKTTAQIGLGALFMFEHLFKERFAILGLSESIATLKRDL